MLYELHIFQASLKFQSTQFDFQIGELVVTYIFNP